jgi:hypothetical protein|uniref:Uncharacterized protein n=1 Tax=viral metagenome TaxID=1070528 RepID=A0A6C0DQ10_9ZZZZ
MYWVLVSLIIFAICYVIANRQSIILEHLDGVKGPVPASPPAAVGAKGSAPLTGGQKKQCDDLKASKNSLDPLKQAVYQAAVDQGKIPVFCEDILNDLSDVGALASKLTTLQQEVDQMKKQAKDQSAQAAAAQASLQAMT